MLKLLPTLLLLLQACIADEHVLQADLVNSTLAQLSYSQRSPPFNYAVDKVRGVNIGGWLVLEPWITPSIFQRLIGVVDEYTLGQRVPHAAGLALLKRHWDTWCTFADFKRIKDAGFNTVRIPIGYWAYRHFNSDPYISGAAKYIDAAVDWARILNLKIWIDLHGAPGGQNAFDNSGQKGALKWQQGNNVPETLAVLRAIATRYAKPDHADVISGIELLNEPFGPSLDIGKIKSFYRSGYNLVRRYGSTFVVIHDAFLASDAWRGFLSPKDHGAQNVLIDHHDYQVFENGLLGLSPRQHQDLACARGRELARNDKWAVVGEWTGAMTDCATWLNGVGTGARYEGKFNGSPRHSSCAGKNDIGQWTPKMKKDTRAFIEAQLDAWERNSKGWIFWNFKTEGAAEWDLFRLLSAGVFPQPLGQRRYKRC